MYFLIYKDREGSWNIIKQGTNIVEIISDKTLAERENPDAEYAVARPIEYDYYAF